MIKDGYFGQDREKDIPLKLSIIQNLYFTSSSKTINSISTLHAALNENKVILKYDIKWFKFLMLTVQIRSRADKFTGKFFIIGLGQLLWLEFNGVCYMVNIWILLSNTWIKL